jgi:hypothetical protein
MPDRKVESGSGHGVGRHPSAQDVTLAREQASRSSPGLVGRSLEEEKGKTRRITLQDGASVDADRAVAVWRLLKDLPHEEPEAFQLLLALAQGDPPVDANSRYFETLSEFIFVTEDHRIDPLTRAVLVNSYTTAEGEPMIAALRLQSTADQAVLEEAQAQYYQNDSEGSARLHKLGGFLDQLWEKMQREKGRDRTPD